MGFFKFIDLKSFYFTSDQYKEYGYGITELYNNGFSIDNLYEYGYTVHEIYDISALQYPNLIGIEYLKSKIDISYGSNGLNQIININNYPLGPLVEYYSNPLNNKKTYEIQRLFQLYDITDLYSNGFGISFMKYNGISIRTLYKLIENNTIQYINLKNGDQKNGFNYDNYTLLDIYSFNNTDTTIFNIYTSLQYSLNDFGTSGFTALQMKNAGVEINNYITNYNNNNTIKSTLVVINPQTLWYYTPYTYLEFLNSGYSSSEFISYGFDLGFFINFVTLSELISVFGDTTLYELIVLNNVPLMQLIQSNYTLLDIFPYRNYYKIYEFIEVGFSYVDLYSAGFSFSDLYNYDYNNNYQKLREILNFNYNVSDIITFDIKIQYYYDASYSSLDLYNNGFLINFLKDNYSLSNFKRDLIPLFILFTSDIYTFINFSNNGYLLSDYFNATIPISFIIKNFTIEELVSVGYTIDEILNSYYFKIVAFRLLGYTAELLSKYYNLDKLIEGGYSKRELNIEGNNISHYCCTKKNILFTQPSILGSSMNETRSSSKISYSQNIKSRIGGSYSTSYSTYLSNTNRPNVPTLCADSLNSTTASSGKQIIPCASINIPSKTSGSFSYFIRNFISKKIDSYNNVHINNQILTNTDIINIYNSIDISQNNFPNTSIYIIIQDLLFPSDKIISGPFSL